MVSSLLVWTLPADDSVLHQVEHKTPKHNNMEEVLQRHPSSNANHHKMGNNIKTGARTIKSTMSSFSSWIVF